MVLSETQNEYRNMAEKLTTFCTAKVAVSSVVRTGFDRLKYPAY
jgi:hypothetical protein